MGDCRHPFKLPSMIATVSTSRNIKATLLYNENSRKGGEVMFSNAIDPSMPVQLQAQVLEAMHNQKYKVKAHTIVISHGDNDSKHLTPEQEKQYLSAFLEELEKRGTDLSSSAWVIARHGNTDNVHYHMAIMNTTLDGGRFNDKFLGKNACRAAAAVSMRFGLERAEKAEEAESRSVRRRSGSAETKQPEAMTLATKTKAKNLYNRRQRIAAAKKRKEDEATQLKAKEKQNRQARVQNRNQRNSRGEEESPRRSFRR